MPSKETSRLAEPGKGVGCLANNNSAIQDVMALKSRETCRHPFVFELSLFSLLFHVNRNLRDAIKIFFQT